MCPHLPTPASASQITAVCPLPSTLLRLGPSPRQTRFHVLRSNCHHHQIDLLPTPHHLPAMPYIDLLHPSDVVSIWYISSSRLGTVNSLQPDKPTIVMLHPLYLNSSWVWGQMDDPRLNSAFNIIAFDTRTSGKSMSTPSGMYDTWVQAADLALCFQVSRASNPPKFPRPHFPLIPIRPPGRGQYLHLPPVHLVGIETVSVNCAQRFAILYASLLTPFSRLRPANTPPIRFPEMILSLTLINVPPPTEYESHAYIHR